MSPSFVTLHLLVSEIAKCIACKNYIESYYCGVFFVKYVHTS